MSIKNLIISRIAIKEDTGCWVWLGTIHSSGYGLFSGAYAHIVAYTAFVGAIAAGKELDHTCRLRCCVNPEHLEQVTRLINVRRGLRSKSSRQYAKQLDDAILRSIHV